jgi:hypothetical protein
MTAVLSVSTFLELEYLIVEEVGVHASDLVLATAVAEHLENSVSSEHLSHWHHINGAGGRAACSGKATPEIQPPAFSRRQLPGFELRKKGGGEVCHQPRRLGHPRSRMQRLTVVHPNAREGR